MNVKENISPEDKLLKLIRGKVKPLDKPAVAGKRQAYRFSSLINIEKILIALFVLAALYSAISFIYPLVGLKKINLPKVEAQKPDPDKDKSGQKREPFDYYGQSIAGRQIFAESNAQGQQSPAAINSNLIKDINLVGILAGETPQAIIEDKKTQKTSYVVKGQYIGELQVEDIQEGKIILNYRGQRYELYL